MQLLLKGYVDVDSFKMHSLTKNESKKTVVNMNITYLQTGNNIRGDVKSPYINYLPWQHSSKATAPPCDGNVNSSSTFARYCDGTIGAVGA